MEYYTNENCRTGVQTAALVFMILGTIAFGLAIIPLAWCIPMCVSYARKTKNGEPVSTAFGVCSILFVSFIGGILVLVGNSY